MLTNVDTSQDDGIIFRSDQYLQLGCDLRDLQRLNSLVRQALDAEQTLVLLVAEVSITYMDSVYSDAVIEVCNTSLCVPLGSFHYLLGLRKAISSLFHMTILLCSESLCSSDGMPPYALEIGPCELEDTFLV